MIPLKIGTIDQPYLLCADVLPEQPAGGGTGNPDGVTMMSKIQKTTLDICAAATAITGLAVVSPPAAVFATAGLALHMGYNVYVNWDKGTIGPESGEGPNQV